MKHLLASGGYVRSWLICLLSFIALGPFLQIAESRAESRSQSPMLSPPPYTFANKVKHTLGRDPDVTVHDMVTVGGGKYLINIDVKNLDKLQALDAIIPAVHKLGNEEVRIRFHDICGNRHMPDKEINPIVLPETAADVAHTVQTAFQGNPLFYATKSGSSFGRSTVYVIFQQAIVQFWNDDLSDYCGNYNAVAASVFRDLVVGKVGKILLEVSTRDDSCDSKHKPSTEAEMVEW